MSIDYPSDGESPQPSASGSSNGPITRSIGGAGVVDAITDAVTTARDLPVDEIPAVEESLNSDALQTLLEDACDDNVWFIMSFQYAGCSVSVTHDRVRVVEAPEEFDQGM